MIKKHPIIFSILFLGAIFAFFTLLFSTLVGMGGGLGITKDSVVVLRLEGTIMDSRDFLEALDKYRKNDHVKAIVLRVDSPGGAVAPSQEMYAELKKVQKGKKIVVSMGSLGASGAYYISMAADKIFVNPGTVTGSIGVIMQSMDVSEILKWAKIEPRVIKTGPLKDTGSPLRPMTPEERDYLQQLIDNMYSQFKQAVVDGRHLPMEKVEELAGGRVYTGEQAVKLGLADSIGTINDAIDEAKKLAGLDIDAPVFWHKKDEPFAWVGEGKSSLMQALANQIDGGLPEWMYLLKY